MEPLIPGKRRGAVMLLAFVTLGLVAWWLQPSPEARQEPANERAARSTAPTSVFSLPQQPKQTTPVDFTPDGVPIRPADSVEVETRGMVPHPITLQHQRIFRENNLIGDLNGAMDVKDAAGMRLLLKEYREEYPEDAHVLQEGYELIADCLERPGPESRAAAQRYYDEQLGSGLRRYIRRHCLEATP